MLEFLLYLSLKVELSTNNLQDIFILVLKSIRTSKIHLAFLSYSSLKFPQCQSRKGNFLLYPHIKVIGLTNPESIISNYQSKFYEFF